MRLATKYAETMVRAFSTSPTNGFAVDDLASPAGARDTADPWITKLIRIGFALMLLYQLVHMIVAILFTSTPSVGVAVEHGFNITSTLVATALTWTVWYRRFWRELVFVQCSAMVLSSVVLSEMTAMPIQFFLAAVLLQVGAAALIPWGWRWQAKFFVVCWLAAAYQIARLQGNDGFGAYLLLGLGTASGLSLFVAALAEHYRREMRSRVEALQESEARLWKVFEAMPDAVTVARLSDGRYLNVSGEFLANGLTRQEALASSDRELGIWVSEQKRRDYWGKLRTRGYINNLEASFQFGNGSVMPCLVSAVVIDLSRGPCVITVMRNISQMKMAENEASATRSLAQSATCAKSDFPAGASSEIRIPVNASLGMAEVMAEGEENAEPPTAPVDCQTDVADARATHATGAKKAFAPRTARRDRPLRVLVADDSADNCLLIQTLLKSVGCRLDQAENGEVAFGKFTSGKYDVVLLDIHMPVMDGYVAARKIRQWERDHNRGHTPIIALTASVLDEEVGKSFEAGCDTHVSKPVRRQTLLAAIDGVTDAMRNRRQATARRVLRTAPRMHNPTPEHAADDGAFRPLLANQQKWPAND
jgi:PAS domain S-box-containing protein